MTVQNPHDRFFRESFGRVEIARNYLEEYLPAPVLELLDLDSLTLQEGSFIDEEMQAHQTDLLYEVQLQTGLEYIHTILYYLSDATEKVTRAELGQAMRQQGREGERVMATIAQEYIQEGLQLGLKQGLEQGRIETHQINVLDLLAIRFEGVDEEVEECITAVTDIPLLRQLHREAATAVSLTAFVEKLTELTKAD